ncbi:MAG TPA: hypothetical protein VE978_27220 [Chitinophagales bacterium]|nr:hypothetical protein [Chitinophagales bacterium]
MVLVYLAMGGIFVFTDVCANILSGDPRLFLGILLMAYGSYRGYYVYRNFIREEN